MKRGPTINVSLTPELRKLVDRKVRSGEYATASEVVREALRELRRAHAERERKFKDLRKLVEAGLRDIEEGRTMTLREARAEVVRRTRARRRGTAA